MLPPKVTRTSGTAAVMVGVFDGEPVGSEVVGPSVGDTEGTEDVGKAVGE